MNSGSAATVSTHLPLAMALGGDCTYSFEVIGRMYKRHEDFGYSAHSRLYSQRSRGIRSSRSGIVRSALPLHQGSSPEEYPHLVCHRVVCPAPPGVASPLSPAPVVPIPYVGTVLGGFEAAGLSKRVHGGMDIRTQPTLGQLQSDLDRDLGLR